jgi:hypothetical protein
VLGLVALVFTFVLRPGLIAQVMAIVSALLGVALLWAFGRRDVWWAVIPGVGLLTLAVICLVYCLLLGSIEWMVVLLLGLGAYVIAVIPNEKVWINVFYILGLILVLVAIVLSPIVLAWQIVLAVAFVLLFVLTLWLDREDVGRLWA